MKHKSKIQKFKDFCSNNNIRYVIDYLEKDKNKVLIELHANLDKNNNHVTFFMSYDTDWRLARYEFKLRGEWFKYKTIESCFNALWEKIIENKITRTIRERNEKWKTY